MKVYMRLNYLSKNSTIINHLLHRGSSPSQNKSPEENRYDPVRCLATFTIITSWWRKKQWNIDPRYMLNLYSSYHLNPQTFPIIIRQNDSQQYHIES